MSLITINHTLVVTALLFAAVALLGVPMAEGLRQEKRGGLRRQLDDEPLSAVKLLTAGRFAILTKTGVTTTGPTDLKGDMGTSPITGAAITGFGLITDPSDTTFSTSSLVTGQVFASDYTSPTPNMLTVAVLDMQAAYVDAAGRPDPDYVELGAGNIEGLTLEPGLYKWGTDVGFTNSLTFDGSDTDIWILQIDGDVTAGSGAKVKLINDAKAENIFWQIAGKTDLGTTSHVEGVFLCSTAITFKTGSSMNGAALAQTAVTLDSATIVKESVCDVDVGCVAPN
uniref:Antifreeze protein n=1 Tax=Chaetoceros neogracilis TaxID=240364 RepID=D2DLE1_9STRA|nr:antifreeze protein [Chaetoceros neogracilis]